LAIIEKFLLGFASLYPTTGYPQVYKFFQRPKGPMLLVFFAPLSFGKKKAGKSSYLLLGKAHPSPSLSFRLLEGEVYRPLVFPFFPL